MGRWLVLFLVALVVVGGRGLAAECEVASDQALAMDELATALDGEFDKVIANGGRPALVSVGTGEAAGVCCHLFSFGEDRPEKFTAVAHYAVDSAGTIYRMDVRSGNEYVRWEPEPSADE